MMKRTPILILVTAIMVMACGGGGEQTAGIDARGNPAPVAGVVSKGAITGFGSVIVNGQTFATTSATFSIDGTPGTQADLAVGDVVVIEGSIGSGGALVARSVSYDDTVEGTISGIDMTAATLTVLGQLVHVDAATSFDDGISPRGLDGLAVGEVIEVSGFFLADGSISATRIERKAPGGEFEVTGTVSNPGATTFTINGFTVDYSAAMLVGFPGGAPENGQRVEAKGGSLGGSGELLATRVEFRSDDLGNSGDAAEVEGFITSFASAGEFQVEGVEVVTSGQTAYVNGTSGNLALNRKIEVEGVINASGVLVARLIEFKPTSELRIESLVEDVQASQLTVLGMTIVVNATTRFEDDSDAKLDIFNLSHVAVGDYVEIRAYEDQGTITASRLDRDEFRGDVALRGYVESVANPGFVILGVMITTDGGTTFRDNDGVTGLSPAAFFGQAAGRLVDAAGTLNGAGIDAVEVQLEN